MNAIGPITSLGNHEANTTTECFAAALDAVRDILGESVSEQVVIVWPGYGFGNDFSQEPVFGTPVFGLFLYSHLTADALVAELGPKAYKATIDDLPYIETYGLSAYELRSAIATL